jgi:8-oxo-dGTP diphosphatase
MITIVVAAAVIEHNSRLLVTRRQKGTHLEGLWEFPGGKCEPAETHQMCLARELREELAVSATVGAEILTTTHTYPDRRVELHFFRCRLLGTPSPQIGQDMRWVTPDELSALSFPPADVELIQLLTRRA